MAPTTLENAPRWAMELLERARVGRLGMVDDAGAPRVLPVTFAVHGDALWTVVDNKPKRAAEPARVRWLRDRPAAALTVDHYADEWSNLAWVQVLGAVSVLRVADHDDALTALAAKYPQYRTERAPGPLLRLAPRRLLCWSASPR